MTTPAIFPFCSPPINETDSPLFNYLPPSLHHLILSLHQPHPTWSSLLCTPNYWFKLTDQRWKKYFPFCEPLFWLPYFSSHLPPTVTVVHITHLLTSLLTLPLKNTRFLKHSYCIWEYHYWIHQKPKISPNELCTPPDLHNFHNTKDYLAGTFSKVSVFG